MHIGVARRGYNKCKTPTRMYVDLLKNCTNFRFGFRYWDCSYIVPKHRHFLSALCLLSSWLGCCPQKSKCLLLHLKFYTRPPMAATIIAPELHRTEQ